MTRIALEALLHGVTLESAYDPVVLPKEEAGRMLGEIFDLLINSAPSKLSATNFGRSVLPGGRCCSLLPPLVGLPK